MKGNGSIHILANVSSGQGQAQTIAHKAQERCRELGLPVHLHLARHRKAMPGALDRACSGARRDGGRVLVIGGDGTVRAVSERLAGTDIVMAVIPTGTFNFFARDLDIPLDPDAALALALEGEVRAVDLGRVNEHRFIINASFGLYARLIRAREQHTRRFGRHRLVAIVSTLLTLLGGYRPLRLELERGGESRVLYSPMVFVGINAVQLRGVDLEMGACIDRRRLGVIVMKPVQRWALFRLTVRGLLHRLRDERSLERFCAEHLSIRPERRSMTVVLDGERLRIRTPLEFGIEYGALKVVAAPKTEDA